MDEIILLVVLRAVFSYAVAMLIAYLIFFAFFSTGSYFTLFRDSNFE